MLIVSNGIAGTLYLKNGSKIKVKGVWEEGDYIGCFVKGGMQKYHKNEILKIEESKVVERSSKEKAKEAVLISFSKKIIKKFSYDNDINELLLILHQPKGSLYEEYFTENKISKVFAIESVKLFYKLPELNSLKLLLNLPHTIFVFDVTKDKIEEIYNIGIDHIREYDDTNSVVIGDNWKNFFLKQYDNKKSRLTFLKQNVIAHEKKKSKLRKKQSLPEKERIKKKIKQIYAEKYPNNFLMQKTMINSQMQTYLFMQGYNSAPGVPQKVFDRIKKKYQLKYPYNFLMQKTLIQSQVQSYIDINR